MKRGGLGLLLASISSAAAAVPLPSANWPAPALRGDAVLRQTMLGLHNQARGHFGVGPLVWNEQLADAARAYAGRMATTGDYRHDSTPGRRKAMGENLWRGPRGVFGYEVMIGTMIDEQRLFRRGAFPNVSTTGQWIDVSHYTQIIWPTTTEVGCALVANATTDYLVCRYAPTGNKDGVSLSPSSALTERGD
jgi:hypothetical protein